MTPSDRTWEFEPNHSDSKIPPPSSPLPLGPLHARQGVACLLSGSITLQWVRSFVEGRLTAC